MDNKPRTVSVNYDDLIEMFCDVNNMFINIRRSVFTSKEVGNSEKIRARQSAMKGRLAMMINSSDKVEVLGSEHHPIKMCPDQIKKILAKAKGIL